MPFRSRAQQRFMFANHPDIAARWEDKYGIPKNLPQHVKKVKKTSHKHKAVNAGYGTSAPVSGRPAKEEWAPFRSRTPLGMSGRFTAPGTPGRAIMNTLDRFGIAQPLMRRLSPSRKRKHKGDGYKRIVDNNMRWQGDTDTKHKIIRINKKKSKKKSTVIDTIVHEEMHAAHPNMHEKTVYKKTPKVVAQMSPKQKDKMYKKYNFTKAEKKLGMVGY